MTSPYRASMSSFNASLMKGKTDQRYYLSYFIFLFFKQLVFPYFYQYDYSFNNEL